jgi:molybdenum cofactor cytidylyltransferase
MSVCAVILAAGASRRMGSPKPLLPLGEGTFLSAIVDTLRRAEVERTLIVLGADAAAIRPALSWFHGAVVLNKGWERGALSSIVSGLDALAQSSPSGVLVWPVDHPLVDATTIRTLLDAFERTRQPIVVPTLRGRRGHPTLFGASMFPGLRSAPPDKGAREVLRTHPGAVCEVPTSDEGIVLNIDTPADLEKAQESTHAE